MSALEAGERGDWTRIITDRGSRWRIYAIFFVILLLLSFFPRPYIARAKILPQENGSAAGLGSMIDVLGGRINELAAFAGQRSSIEAYLVIGRSNEVGRDVVKQLAMAGPGRRYRDEQAALRALNRKVDVHALLGGTLEIETFTHDPDEALTLATALVGAVNRRINALSRYQVNAKRSLVSSRFGQAAERVTQSGQELDAFRQRYRLADPAALFGAAVSQRANLEGELQGKLVELQSLRSLLGEENPRIRETLSEIQALRSQIAQTNNMAHGGDLNLASQTRIYNQYLDLFRNYRFAQSLFDVYSRFSEQVELQELASESGVDVQVIESPHLDVERHYNVPAVALLSILVVLIAFFEFYAPATGMHLPMRSAGLAD